MHYPPKGLLLKYCLYVVLSLHCIGVDILYVVCDIFKNDEL